MQTQEKTTVKHSEITEIQSSHDYENALLWLEKWGQKQYGKHFSLREEDKPVLFRLLSYFLKDETVASKLNINLNKGILLSGPIGVGKTSILSLMRLFEPAKDRFILRSCRDVSFEFIKDGYDTIHKYSRHSFHSNTHDPKIYCFDDLGTENTLKYYGNECNVMAEVLLSRYDLFVSRQLITHLTTNLSASEIEEIYGSRIRSRMREMFNLISFSSETQDKRK
ncbi:MAG TPA: AAA family ATPase [Bacteroidia bacterium]|jgi:DNA replication protein DnaC